jgi:hypothetical protein
MSRISRRLGLALLVSCIAIAFSIFFGVVGVPYTGVSITESCVTNGVCSQTTAPTNVFVPTSVAAIPLLAGAVLATGLFRKIAVLCWAGAALMLGFSLVGISSIGLL